MVHYDMSNPSSPMAEDHSIPQYTTITSIDYEVEKSSSPFNLRQDYLEGLITGLRNLGDLTMLKRTESQRKPSKRIQQVFTGQPQQRRKLLFDAVTVRVAPWVQRDIGLPQWLKAINFLVMLAVFVSSITIAIELDNPNKPSVLEAIKVSDICCTAIFGAEIVIKVLLMKRKYFLDYWNYLDILLVVISVLDKLASSVKTTASPALLLRVLRMTRILRIVRFFKVFRELWLIIIGLCNALKAMLWIMLLILITLYVFALLCVMTIRDSDGIYPGLNPVVEREFADFNPYDYFGTVPDTMVTLFHLVVMDEFSAFAKPVWHRQTWFFPIFLIFIVLTSFALLNMLIGVIVQCADDASKSLAADQQKLEESNRIHQMIRLTTLLDPKGSGNIDISCLEDACSGDFEEAHALMRSLHFPPCFQADELLLLMGASSGDVSVEQFGKTAIRLVSCAADPFEWHCLAMLRMNQVLATLHDIGAETGGVKVRRGHTQEGPRKTVDGLSGSCHNLDSTSVCSQWKPTPSDVEKEEVNGGTAGPTLSGPANSEQSLRFLWASKSGILGSEGQPDEPGATCRPSDATVQLVQELRRCGREVAAHQAKWEAHRREAQRILAGDRSPASEFAKLLQRLDEACGGLTGEAIVEPGTPDARGSSGATSPSKGFRRVRSRSPEPSFEGVPLGLGGLSPGLGATLSAGAGGSGGCRGGRGGGGGVGRASSGRSASQPRPEVDGGGGGGGGGGGDTGERGRGRRSQKEAAAADDGSSLAALKHAASVAGAALSAGSATTAGEGKSSSGQDDVSSSSKTNDDPSSSTLRKAQSQQSESLATSSPPRKRPSCPVGEAGAVTKPSSVTDRTTSHQPRPSSSGVGTGTGVGPGGAAGSGGAEGDTPFGGLFTATSSNSSLSRTGTSARGARAEGVEGGEEAGSEQEQEDTEGAAERSSMLSPPRPPSPPPGAFHPPLPGTNPEDFGKD